MKDVARQTIATIVSQWSAVKIGSSCVIGALQPGSPAYDRLTGGKTPQSGRTPLGIIVKESMRRHPDGLSVTGGIWQHSTNEEAPTQEWAWIVADDNGNADVDYLCRDGGKAEKLMAGMI